MNIKDTPILSDDAHTLLMARKKKRERVGATLGQGAAIGMVLLIVAMCARVFHPELIPSTQGGSLSFLLESTGVALGVGEIIRGAFSFGKAMYKRRR